MADSNYNRSFRRADGERPQQQRDERDRRERGGRGRGRDQDRDDRDWDRPRDRGNRYRDRDRDRDWDADRDRDRDRDRDHDRNRRYRSRSRDRRDRRRSRSRSPVRDDNRARRQRPEEPTAPSEAPNRGSPPLPLPLPPPTPDTTDLTVRRGPRNTVLIPAALYYEESSPIQAAFPARDANLPPPAHDTHGPRVEDAGRADDHDSDHGAANTGLPTRPRVSDKQHASTAGPATTMSFRVGGDHAGHHGEEGRGRSRQRDDNSTAMDEDGEHAGQDRDHSEEGEADDDDEVVIEDDGTADAMQAMMGFSGFSSTKGKKVPGNNVGAVHKAKKTEYRQYMNRVGGFNRPLSPSR